MVLKVLWEVNQSHWLMVADLLTLPRAAMTNWAFTERVVVVVGNEQAATTCD